MRPSTIKADNPKGWPSEVKFGVQWLKRDDTTWVAGPLIKVPLSQVGGEEQFQEEYLVAVVNETAYAGQRQWVVYTGSDDTVGVDWDTKLEAFRHGVEVLRTKLEERRRGDSDEA